MLRKRRRFRGLVAALAVIGVMGATACAHVNREELDTRLAEVEEELRAEQQEGDERLAERIDATQSDLAAVSARADDNSARIEGLERALEELSDEFAVTVERLEGMVAFNVPVHFDFDSSTLRDDAEPVLDRFAAVYREFYDGNLVTVEGFTDEAGSDAYNERLGRRRAEEVRGYLVEVAGVDGSRIRTVSYGEADERLVEPGAFGPERGEANRRVTLVVETAGSQAAPAVGDDRPAASAPDRSGGDTSDDSGRASG